MRLFRSQTPFRSRWHFYNVSARAMVQTLIDASRRNADRVGRNSVGIDPTFDVPHRATLSYGDSVHTRLAFESMRQWDPLVAETVWLRFVEGFTLEETARHQRRALGKVREDCGFGLKWLNDRLRSPRRK